MLKRLFCEVDFRFDRAGHVTSEVVISAFVETLQEQQFALRFFARDAAQVSCTQNGLPLVAQIRDAGVSRTLSYAIQTQSGDNTIVARHPLALRFLSEGKSESDSVWVAIVPLRQYRSFGVDQSVECELRASLPRHTAAERLLLKKRSIALGGKSDSEERGVVYNAKISGGNNLITAVYSPGFSFPDQLSVKAGNF